MFTTDLEFAVNGWSPIATYEVGIVRGVGSSEAGSGGMSNVYRATSLKELVRMLDRERFDLMVTDLFSGKVEIRRQQLVSRVRPLLPPLERIYIRHYLHERHRTLVPQVEPVLRRWQRAANSRRCAPGWSRRRTKKPASRAASGAEKVAAERASRHPPPIEILGGDQAAACGWCLTSQISHAAAAATSKPMTT